MYARLLLLALAIAGGGVSAPVEAGQPCLASAGNDMRIASAVMQEFSARYTNALESRLRPHRAGVRPGCQGNVILDVYGVVLPEGFKAMEQFAREAQAAVPGAATVSLRFFEREVWISREGGGGYRGKEKLLKTVTLPSRLPAARQREG